VLVVAKLLAQGLDLLLRGWLGRHLAKIIERQRPARLRKITFPLCAVRRRTVFLDAWSQSLT
jgi:hypothetical protein